ncbi:hypothetical protein BJ742DRAFT_827986 [Cladochytrium replicatum]|nr:hypothetical protein BJ742DRAFT_827986 [Cladochytrium replicatum]
MKVILFLSVLAAVLSGAGTVQSIVWRDHCVDLCISNRRDAARGRPHLNGKTFVADNGQLLRGPFTSTEWAGPVRRSVSHPTTSRPPRSVHIIVHCSQC